MQSPNKVVKIILPILLILIAVGLAVYIVKTTKKPEKKRPERTAYAVKVVTVNAADQLVELQATGSIIPSLEITLRSRVAGEIVDVASEFIAGGTFRQGEQILKIDPADYQLALEQKKAALAEAEYQLKLEEGQRDIAAREWELIARDEEAGSGDRDLALRVPHLKYRTAQLKAAIAELDKAELDLARTVVTAPFNAVVVDRKTDLGAQTSSQDSLATLVGTDLFYVRAAIPVDRIQWIECDPDTGSEVTITRGTGAIRRGRVVRLESNVEEAGRMARVLIEIKDPLQGEQPVLLNEYVRVTIAGAPIKNAYQIPRSALHDDRFAWIATSDDTLEMRAVNVVWRDATTVIIAEGLADGERLILSNLSTPINGMNLRVEGADSQQLGSTGNGKPGKGMNRDEG